MCPWCGSAYETRAEFRRHLRVVHHEKVNVPTYPPHVVRVPVEPFNVRHAEHLGVLALVMCRRCTRAMALCPECAIADRWPLYCTNGCSAPSGYDDMGVDGHVHVTVSKIV